MHMVLVPAPRIQERRTVPYFPLGVLSLHQVLSDAGHDSRIYVPVQDSFRQVEPDVTIGRWAADIVAAKPDWVGFSTMCSTYPLVLLLSRAVKHLSPHTRVVLGGPQASVVAGESMAAFPWIDYIVRGEAEQAILDLVQVVAGKRKPDKVLSLTFRTNGRIVSTPLNPLLNDLDSLPVPDYRAYPLFHEALIRGADAVGDRGIPLEAGRGCPHGCSFCSTSAFWRRRRRQKTARLLAEQIGPLVRRYEVKNVSLVQDLFAVDRDWLVAFLRAMEAGDGANWRCGLRPDSVDEQTLADMQRAGCSHIGFGVESGSQRVQKLLQKNLGIAKTCRTIEAAVAHGIGVATSFIVGFPWETAQDLQETLSLHQHFLSIGVEKSHISVLYPLPKTQITTRYASGLTLAPGPSFLSRGLAGFRNAEMDRMIRQYPQIFSSFYYVKPEFVSHEDFLAAAWAGNALSALSKGESLVAQTRTGAENESDSSL